METSSAGCLGSWVVSPKISPRGCEGHVVGAPNQNGLDGSTLARSRVVCSSTHNQHTTEGTPPVKRCETQLDGGNRMQKRFEASVATGRTNSQAVRGLLRTCLFGR